MKLISKLLRKNTSLARIAGFILSNFIGLAIIAGGIQFYTDARSLWASDDSFIKSDFLVVNKKVTSSNLWDDSGSGFTVSEIDDIRSQPWVRKVGGFSSTDYRVWASVDQGGRGLSTMLFFESVPDDFVDVEGDEWRFKEGDAVVPIVISKDYLALYNFGFASSAGLPQMSENLISGIPLTLSLSSEDGSRTRRMRGRIVGYSSRLNTILVPESFMAWSNSELGRGMAVSDPSRLIIDVSSPGDVAIKDYLEAHDLEVAGDKSGSSASYLLKVVTGIVLGVGGVITVLSFFILLLSMSLLMEKNRSKLHSLLMLGCPLRDVASPYVRIVVVSSLCAGVLAICGVGLLRWFYIDDLAGLGAAAGNGWCGVVTAIVLTLIIILLNIYSVRKKVRYAWR
ncbi:MAG: ABC transporter permease [Muribaculaceae bacterium]|nr:ABC transporter permease [Muribaculaceae bacterium]MDE5713136.1 ABC transporter permease [Muribaculaceae bacterium]